MRFDVTRSLGVGPLACTGSASEALAPAPPGVSPWNRPSYGGCRGVDHVRPQSDGCVFVSSRTRSLQLPVYRLEPVRGSGTLVPAWFWNVLPGSLYRKSLVAWQVPRRSRVRGKGLTTRGRHGIEASGEDPLRGHGGGGLSGVAR
jgi:hypothetical protein